MKKLSLIVALLLVASLALPAAAQYSGSASRPAAATRSVLEQSDQVEWADYHVGTVAGPGISGCPDAHMTCVRGVCHGYDNCCCPPPYCCCLKKIARMLDCLLPCNKCCPGGCLFGGCRPHLFHRGCCGGCDVGCSAPSCSSPIGYPGVSDPFIDDPIPPQPMPEPARDVRYSPAPMPRSPAPLPPAARKSSPYKVTTLSEVARQQEIEASRAAVAPIAAPAPAAHNPRDKYAAQPRALPTHSRPAPKPVLPAAAEEEIIAAPIIGDEAPAPPALLPVTIQRTSAELPSGELEIPVNPLRP
ncbi:MAG: hypothetical protein L0211_17330 [Planctomycetaceae bacterium]|nr:hypothetical protein [Planctomycetaceae bacterium]